jgi:hypothetical protein
MAMSILARYHYRGGHGGPLTLRGLLIVIGLLLAYYLVRYFVRARRESRDEQAGRPHASFPHVDSEGWYPDAVDPAQLRYFNGENWTMTTKPRE